MNRFAIPLTSILKTTLAASLVASAKVGDEEQDGKKIQVESQNKKEPVKKIRKG